MSTLEGAIAFFRRQRIAQFRAEGKVTRSAGPGSFNPSTGEIDEPEPTLIYEGVCNVREMAWQGTDVGIGGSTISGTTVEEIRLRRAELFFPHDIAILEDDVLTVTAAKHDSSLVGARYRITDVFLDAWQVSRRAMGEKVTNEPEAS